MKITPLEIRQKEFEKKLRGYDKDEVSAFLQSLSNEWERVLEENKELNIKLQQSEKEVSKLREVESSLYKTLKTAEDTGANVIDQANKAAELHMKETKMNAEALLNESKNKARAMIEKAEVEARQIIDELQDAVNNLEQNHREIENHRQASIQELKNLSISLIEKVERTTKETKEFRIDDYVKRVKKLARASDERIKSEKTEVSLSTSLLKTSPLATDGAKASTEEYKSEVDATLEKHKGQEAKQEEAIPTKESQPPKPVVPARENAPKKKQVSEGLKDQSETSEEPSVPEKKGPRISRTVSFFDEIETDK